MLDIADRRRERALVVINDPSRHVLGRQTVIGPDDRDHGDPDVRENVRRRTESGASAENEDQDRQNDERVRPLQGHEDNGVHRCTRAISSAVAYQASGPLGRLMRYRRINFISQASERESTSGALHHSYVVVSFLALRHFRTVSPGAARITDATRELVQSRAFDWSLTKVALSG